MKIVVGALLLLVASGSLKAAPEPLEFREGDHISIIGNALADRMQHDGWLETLLSMVTLLGERDIE